MIECLRDMQIVAMRSRAQTRMLYCSSGRIRHPCPTTCAALRIRAARAEPLYHKQVRSYARLEIITYAVTMERSMLRGSGGVA